MVYKSRPGEPRFRSGRTVDSHTVRPAGMVCAQDKPSAQQLAAPPMKALTREERTQLESIKDEKSRSNERWIYGHATENAEECH